MLRLLSPFHYCNPSSKRLFLSQCWRTEVQWDAASKGTAWRHKSNTKHMLCRCPLEKPVDFRGLSFQPAQFPSLPTMASALVHRVGGWVAEERASGTASITASNCLFFYLVYASMWQKGPFLKLSIYFNTKQWWDIPASYSITYIFSCCKKNTGGDWGSCCHRKTGRDQGSCWSLPVTGGLELMSCSPHGWQKYCLNSRVGDALYGELLYLLSPGVGGDCGALSLLFGWWETTSYGWSWGVKPMLYLLQGTFLAVDLAFLGAGAQIPERRKVSTMCLKCQWLAFTFSSAEHMSLFGEGHTSLDGVLVPNTGGPKCCTGL